MYVKWPTAKRRRPVFLCRWLVAPNHNSPHLEYTLKKKHLLCWCNWQSSNTLAAIIKAWVCDGWTCWYWGVRIPLKAWIPVSCLWWMLCVVMQRSLRWADHSSREVLPCVCVCVCLCVCVCVCVCVSECYIEISTMRRPRPTRAVKRWKICY
jgi:hypothetical protein